MFNIRLAGGHLYGKQLVHLAVDCGVFLWRLLCCPFFPLDVLDGIWDLIESVSEGFLTYSCTLGKKSSVDNRCLLFIAQMTRSSKAKFPVINREFEYRAIAPAKSVRYMNLHIFHFYQSERFPSFLFISQVDMALKMGCASIEKKELIAYGETSEQRNVEFVLIRGWSSGVMVLGKLPVLGRPTILIAVGQGPTALAVGGGGGCLDNFTLLYPFSLSSFSLSSGDCPI